MIWQRGRITYNALRDRSIQSHAAEEIGKAAVVAHQAGSLSDNARALALINMAISDSLVASFFNKYHCNFWRPETAIHEGDLDGNPHTVADPTYVPFITTPCFPSYPSNHGSAPMQPPRS